MGRDALDIDYLLVIIKSAEQEAMNGYRYDEATVLYRALEEIRFHLTRPTK
jgi:hypothetical protein